jgi:hypothetical protein
MADQVVQSGDFPAIRKSNPPMQPVRFDAPHSAPAADQIRRRNNCHAPDESDPHSPHRASCFYSKLLKKSLICPEIAASGREPASLALFKRCF